MSDRLRADRARAGAVREANRDASHRITARTLTRVLWLATLTVVAADLITTLYGLSVGYAERNPVVAAVIARYGLAGMLGLKAAALAWPVAVRRALGPVYGAAALVGLFLPQAVAVALNLATLFGL